MARGRSGISTQVTNDIVRRYRVVRALWLAVQNQPDVSIQDVASEFYCAIGDLLEGKSLRQIELRRIDLKRVLQHVKEG
jgi:hypothetical protein